MLLHGFMFLVNALLFTLVIYRTSVARRLEQAGRPDDWPRYYDPHVLRSMYQHPSFKAGTPEEADR